MEDTDLDCMVCAGSDHSHLALNLANFKMFLQLDD